MKNALFLLAATMSLIIAQVSQANLSPIIEAEDSLQAGSPALSAAIHSPNSADRIAAATAYARIQDPSGVPPLLGLLGDPDPSVVEAAIFNLGQFGWSIPAAAGHEDQIAQAIAPFLNSPLSPLRAAAFEAYGKLEAQTGEATIARGLDDPSPRVRAAATLALALRSWTLEERNPSASAAPPLSDPDFQALAGLSADPSVKVRQNVGYFFAQNKDPRGVPLLLKLSRDFDFWTRYYAIGGLGNTGQAGVASRLTELLLDPSYIIRVAALQALASLKSIGSLSSWQLELLSHDLAFQVRAALCDGLATLSAPTSQIQTLLNGLVQDSSPQVRGEAYQALATLNPSEALPILSAAIVSDHATTASWVARVGAVLGLSNLGAQAAAPLLQAAQDDDVRVRIAALPELAPLSGTPELSAIVHALSASDFSERETAEDAIAARPGEPTAAADLWTTYLNSEPSIETDDWDSVREEAISDLLALPPGELPPTSTLTSELTQALRDPDPTAANFALQGLQNLGVPNLPAPFPPRITYSPYREIDFGPKPIVVLETTRGPVVIELDTQIAPISVATFVGFAQAKGYDGLPWHRVVSDFVVQGGDPDGTGYGDAGYSLRQETGPQVYRRGTVGLARATSYNSYGSQFFINTVPTPFLNGLYTIIGKVIGGMEVVDRLQEGDLILTARQI